MKIIKTKAPKSYSSQESVDFDEGEIRDIEATGADVVAYWYVHEDYEGSGYILLHFPSGELLLESASHCSCYGPTEHLMSVPAVSWASSMQDLVGRFSPDMFEEARPLVEAMQEHLKTGEVLAKAFQAN